MDLDPYVTISMSLKDKQFRSITPLVLGPLRITTIYLTVLEEVAVIFSEQPQDKHLPVVPTLQTPVVEAVVAAVEIHQYPFAQRKQPPIR